MEVVPVSDSFTIKDIQKADSAPPNSKPTGNNYPESLDSGFSGEDAATSSPESRPKMLPNIFDPVFWVKSLAPISRPVWSQKLGSLNLLEFS